MRFVRPAILIVVTTALALALLFTYPSNGIWGTIFFGGLGLILVVGAWWTLYRRSGQEAAEVSGTRPAYSVTEHSFNSRYEVGIGLTILTEVVGWLVVVSALIAIFPLMIKYGPLVAIGAAAGAVTGLSLVLFANVTRAIIDNADHTREVMNLLATQLQRPKITPPVSEDGRSESALDEMGQTPFGEAKLG
ncbi:MAG: hypothetical protein LAT63_16990 [Marinobacter sp.]|nr:hypothetical protein [Marinobacter sp.]